MNSEQVEAGCNSYDSRCGFTPTDEEDTYQLLYQRALRAREHRLKYPTGKMRLSKYLKTTKIKQSFNHFIVKGSGNACALGAIQLATTCAKRSDTQTNWYGVCLHFDVESEELDRQVRCPGKQHDMFDEVKEGRCHQVDSIAALLFHLNDVHKYNFPRIGRWLEEFKL